MPVAHKGGKLLAKRISSRLQGGNFNQLCDYSNVPTTVFTPVEYSYVGLNEQEAIKKYGDENVDVYMRELTALNYSLYKENSKMAFMKVIVNRNENEKVLGIHYMGPGADELISPFSIGMKKGMLKEDLDGVIGVHPSTGEDLFNLEITKRSGDNYTKTEC